MDWPGKVGGLVQDGCPGKQGAGAQLSVLTQEVRDGMQQVLHGLGKPQGGLGKPQGGPG